MSNGTMRNIVHKDLKICVSNSEEAAAVGGHEAEVNDESTAASQEPHGQTCQHQRSDLNWAGVSATWKLPLIFVSEGVKINSMLYIEDILVPAAAAAKVHFKNRPRTLQQDGTSAHTANVTQKWCKENLPGFWEKSF